MVESIFGGEGGFIAMFTSINEVSRNPQSGRELDQLPSGGHSLHGSGKPSSVERAGHRRASFREAWLGRGSLAKFKVWAPKLGPHLFLPCLEGVRNEGRCFVWGVYWVCKDSRL